MPSSQHFQISKIMNLIIHLAPKSLLDIGPGFGKYGLLCREYLDMWQDDGQAYGTFSTRIDAIEVFQKYLTPVHKYVYDHVHVGDALALIDTVPRYDLILMIDVLEHFDRERGRTLLDKALKKSENLLISVPRDLGDQGELFGNKHETHLGAWSTRELLALAPGFRIRDPISHIVFLSFGAPQRLAELRRIMDPPALIGVKRALSGWA
jgi:hypothetical protein